MSKIKRNTVYTLIIVLILALVGAIFLFRFSESDKSNNENGELSKKFNSTLSSPTEELIFSIPKDTKIPASCFICEEQGIDVIEGQYWNFAVSSDYENFAYPVLENGKDRIVFNGEKKKIYDDVYLVKFSPNGNDLLYHAYDKKKDITYLVYNDEEIIAYSGREGWPQAANGFREVFSKDGKHFAFSKIINSNEVQIVLDGKVINTARGLDASLIRFDGDTVEYIIDLKSRTGPHFDYDYYRGDEFIETLSFDEFNAMQKGFYEYYQDEIEKDNMIKIDRNNKSVLVNDVEITNYRDRDPKVYLSYLIEDDLGNNFAYIIITSATKKDVWVSLNGMDSESKFNDIKDMHFSEDGKKLIYIGRRGRGVYKVTHEILLPR